MTTLASAKLDKSTTIYRYLIKQKKSNIGKSNKFKRFNLLGVCVCEHSSKILV